ncbi:hypothetical protein [Streptomyces capitiformicae]|nr:hypothetical protein [Streptomyces capitiformicae]
MIDFHLEWRGAGRPFVALLSGLRGVGKTTRAVESWSVTTVSAATIR